MVSDLEEENANERTRILQYKVQAAKHNNTRLYYIHLYKESRVTLGLPNSSPSGTVMYLTITSQR